MFGGTTSVDISGRLSQAFADASGDVLSGSEINVDMNKDLVSSFPVVAF